MLRNALASRESVALMVALLGACGSQPGRRDVAPVLHPPPVSAPKAAAADATKTWLVPYFGTVHHEVSAWSPDGRFALTRQQADRALLFGAAQAAPIAGLPLAGDWYAAVWSRDSKRFIAASDIAAPRMTLIDIRAHERPVTWTAAPGDLPALPIGFLVDGRRIVARTKATVARILDASTGSTLGPEIPIAERSVLALARTHPFLAHGVETGFAITDVETGMRIFASERPALALTWASNAPKLAVRSDRSVLVWDPERGLVELPGNGDATWDQRGDRIALASLPSGSGSPWDHPRCTACLRPVRWTNVIDLATRREIPTSGFRPDRRRELSSFSLFDLETNEARPLRAAPDLTRGIFYFSSDDTLVMKGTRWVTKIDLATGRTVVWVPPQEEPGWTFDPERRIACENDRWTVRDRFSGTIVAQLGPGTTCKDTHLRLLRTPVVAYLTARETQIIDASTQKKTLLRLPGNEHRPVVDPTGTRFAFHEKGQTFVITLETLAKAPWGPPNARPIDWPDAHTLTLSTLKAGANLAIRDGVALKESPQDLERTPARPFGPRGLTFPKRSPSGRFVVQGGDPPAFVLRTADGAALRLLVIETPERPYSVLVDEQGRFAGDDEAARRLLYATGTSLEALALHTGLEVADRFREPTEIAAFFRR